MSVQISQVRAVRALMQERRRGTVDHSSDGTPPVDTPAVPLRVYDGEAVRRADPMQDLHVALGDIVLSASAVDGAIAIAQGPDLRIAASVRGLIPRRTLSRDMSPALWEVIQAGRPLWLADPSMAGIHLPPHAQVIAVPFRAGTRDAIALLSFHSRRAFSHADLGWLAHVLTKAATPHADDTELAAA